MNTNIDVSQAEMASFKTPYQNALTEDFLYRSNLDMGIGLSKLRNTSYLAGTHLNRCPVRYNQNANSAQRPVLRCEPLWKVDESVDNPVKAATTSYTTT